MKRIFLFFALVMMSILTMAQAPQKMNFQALIRNSDNELVTNQTVSVEISVLNSTNTAVYTETQSVTTNANGVATLVIGEGTATVGSFAAIDWSADKYYLQTTADLGNDEEAIVGTTPLLSVPYALYAEKAGNADVDLTDYAKKSDIPAEVDLSDYATKSEIPDLTDYAKKSDIPAEVDLSDYATKSEIPDLTDYAKKSDIPAEVDLSDYATKSEIPDLTDYAKRSDIPAEVDLSGYATKADVTVATTDMSTKTYVGEEIAKINIPTTVFELTDAADYAKKTDIPTTVSTFTNDAKYTKSGENISVFINDVEYVKKSYVDSLFGVLGTRMQTINLKTLPKGIVKGVFSVSANKQVCFSQGNLQYQASTSTWRFAENQYDMIGDANSNVSSTYDGWIDLFGWGTSGYNGKNPYMTSTDYNEYGVAGDYYADIAGTNYDWGVYNAISNGGNAAGLWRTLTYDEWHYVLFERANADTLMGSATVNGVNGMILLPDDWTTPDGVTFNSGMNGFNNNTYSTTEWSKMETNGAVFLPYAGSRYELTYNTTGSYWSSSVELDNDGAACYLKFEEDYTFVRSFFRRNYGYSVRLVCDL